MIKSRRSFIIGIKGIKLNRKEFSFIKKYKPWGVILFTRNIKTIEQTNNKKRKKFNFWKLLENNE